MSSGTSLRRSCQGCVKVKRRCDLLYPDCSRCLKKGIRCQYINVPLSGRASPPGDGHSNHGRVVKPTLIRPQQQQQQHQQHQHQHQQRCNRIIVEAIKPKFENDTEPEIKPKTTALIVQRQTRQSPSSDEGSDEGSIASDDSLSTITTVSSNYSNSSYIRPAMDIEIRKQHSPYIINIIADAVRQAPRLYIQDQSFFIHPCVYEKSLPRAVRDMRALCALYENNNQNSPQSSQKPFGNLSNLLQRQISTLIHTGHQTGDFEELVACTQALTLALCLQLSEGTVSGPVVDKNLTHLASITRRMWYLVPSELPSSMSPWHAWIFGETVRRTIVFSHLVIAVFSFLSRGYACRTPFIDALPFDGRTYLWGARSEQEWAKYSSRQDHQMVSLIEYTDLLQSGRALCFSSFESLIIATCRGLDLPVHDPLTVMRS